MAFRAIVAGEYRLHNTVERAWISDSLVFPMESVMTKIDACRTSLMQWSNRPSVMCQNLWLRKKHLLK